MPARRRAPRAPKQESWARPQPLPARDEDPGLVLISRRPPQQKFTNFEEYMNAHGGATHPLRITAMKYEPDEVPRVAGPAAALAGEMT